MSGKLEDMSGLVVLWYMYMSLFFRCSLCGRRCPSKIALKSHLKCHDSEGGGFPAKCDVCNRMFSRKHLMERHKLHKHTNHQTQYKCTECSKVFGHQSKILLVHASECWIKLCLTFSLFYT